MIWLRQNSPDHVHRRLNKQYEESKVYMSTTTTTRLMALYPGHSLANWDSCPTPAKSEAIEYLQVGPTEIRYSIAWTIFVYL